MILICTNFEQLGQLVSGLSKTCVLLTPSRAFVWNHYAKELLFAGFWTMPTESNRPTFGQWASSNNISSRVFAIQYIYIYMHMAYVYTYIWLCAYIHVYTTRIKTHVYIYTYDIFDWVSLVVVSLHCGLIFSKVKTTLMALVTGTSSSNFSPFSTCPLYCREAPWWQYQLGALGRLCLLTLGCPCCDLWGTCFLRFQWLHQLWKKNIF